MTDTRQDGGAAEDALATDFYIEFQTVCQAMHDDTLPQDVARWALSAVERHTLIEFRDWLRNRHPLPRGEINADLINEYARERGHDLTDALLTERDKR